MAGHPTNRFTGFATFTPRKSGGFDVIIGNSPYAEIPKEYTRSYLTQVQISAPVWSRDEDLCTFLLSCSARNTQDEWQVWNDPPLSLSFSTKKPFVELRKVIDGENGLWWWSHFDRIPSGSFGSEVRTRCTISPLQEVDLRIVPPTLRLIALDRGRKSSFVQEDSIQLLGNEPTRRDPQGRLTDRGRCSWSSYNRRKTARS